jgi:hypothetical protein
LQHTDNCLMPVSQMGCAISSLLKRDRVYLLCSMGLDVFFFFLDQR